MQRWAGGALAGGDGRDRMGKVGVGAWWHGGLLGRLLPHGVPLPADNWSRRHEALLVALWLVTGVVSTWSMLGSHLGSADLHLAVALAFAVATAASLPRSRGSAHRELTSSVVTFGLLWCSAIVVRLSGGAIEAHFLFFVVVAAATLYQSWAPFLTTVAFVIVHDGVIGSLRPGSVYDHPGTSSARGCGVCCTRH